MITELIDGNTREGFVGDIILYSGYILAGFVAIYIVIVMYKYITKKVR